MNWPRLGPVAFDNTCRLIPGQYAEAPEYALADLVDTTDELDDLVRLSAATNSRLQAQAERHPAGLGRADLVFGVPYSKIINAAFANGGEGARFHPPGPRGAWYCATEVDTCLVEIAHHRIEHLREVDVPDEADIPYRLFVADIHGQDFALLDDHHPAGVACLDPASYSAGQTLAVQLRNEDRGGVLYPSVRQPEGTCLAVLQAPIVTNVRRDTRYRLTIRDFSLAEVVSD